MLTSHFIFTFKSREFSIAFMELKMQPVIMTVRSDIFESKVAARTYKNINKRNFLEKFICVCLQNIFMLCMIS